MSDINVTIQENLKDASATFERYWKLTGKSRAEALTHFGGNFSIAATRAMKARMYAKGAIRSERLGAFKSGVGLRISDRARALVSKKYGVTVSPGGRTYMQGSGKRGFSKAQRELIQRLNRATGGGITLQALLAMKEIQLREGHRGFTTSAFLFKGMKGKDSKGRTKYYAVGNGVKLGEATATDRGSEGDELAFVWGEGNRFSRMAARGVSSQRGREAVAEGLKGATRDALNYIARKQAEAARNAARSIRGL